MAIKEMAKEEVMKRKGEKTEEESKRNYKLRLYMRTSMAQREGVRNELK